MSNPADDGRPSTAGVTVVIPTKNEAATITRVVTDARHFAEEVLVLDGHSTDDTRLQATAAGARVVVDEGLGKGAALRQGLREAAGKIVVFMDADGSHDPEDIPRLVEPIRRGEADLVVGDRMRGGSDELHGTFGNLVRLLGTEVLTLMVNARWHSGLRDIQNGFRAIRRDVGLSLGLREQRFAIEEEMVMKSLQRGYRVINVPSHEYERFSGASRISLLREAVSFVWCILKHWPRKRVKREVTASMPPSS